MQLYHDSRSLDCRAPLGAVKCGTVVRFRLFGAYGAQQVKLIFIVDHKAESVPMEMLYDGAFETRHPMPGAPSVAWYYFEVERPACATKYYGNARDMLGGVGECCDGVPPAFQITVYDPAYQTPAYLRGGVMYQIFPDRFARSKPPASPRRDIVLHENWDDKPLERVESVPGDNFALDFFGGDLKGIEQKLDYLAGLGVTVLYFNPIFEGRANHRYGTADYTRIDPILGAERDFSELCEAARTRGIRVILDGVFSHTGDDSVYFNRYGHYDSVGAYQSKESAFYSWYTFRSFPDDYACWWGFQSLPELNKGDEGYRRFLMGEDGVAHGWLRRGAAGWRLDVADELPMDFLRELRAAIKREKRDAAIIAEVWEDASRKEAYGALRSYCLGDTADSVMNYPLRAACIEFLMGRADASALVRVILSQQENYAPPFYYSLMNLMGSHDRARILSVLSGTLPRDDERGDGHPAPLTPEQYILAKRRMLVFLRILVSLPGIPCVYYGDEAGCLGAADPYCRGTYPWGREDQALIGAVRALLALRKKPALRAGTLECFALDADTLVIRRAITLGHDVFGAPAPNSVYEARIRRPI